MKRSLALMSALVLAFAGVAACADSDEANPAPTPVDAGEAVDAMLPSSDVDAAEPVRDASVEAGPRKCSYHGFCPTVLPAAQTLVDVWGDGTGIVWAVSAEGSVLRWDGTQWQIHASDLGPLTAIWGSEPTDVWIGGENGVFHGTGATSAALAFTPSSLPEYTLAVASIWGLSSSDVWAVGTGYDLDAGTFTGIAVHCTSGGNCEPVRVASGTRNFSRVWGSAKSGVWIAGQRPNADMPWIDELAAYRKSDSDEFTDVTLPPDPHIGLPLGAAGFVRTGGFVSDGTMWLSGGHTGGGPLLWRGTSTDEGKTFSFTAAVDGAPNDPPTNALFGTADDDVWVAGEYGQVRHWNGTKWMATAVTNTDLPITTPFYGVWARGSSEVWLVGKDIALRYDPTQKQDGGAK